MTAQRRPRSRPEPATKLKLRLWLRLLRAARSIEVELRERLRVAFGVTLPKFDVMSALDRKGAGMTMTELSRFLMVSNGNVTGIIDRLVAEGMVVRAVHEADRRATFVKPHAQGRRSSSPPWRRRTRSGSNEILAGFSREDSEALVGLLDELRAHTQDARRSTHAVA